VYNHACAQLIKKSYLVCLLKFFYSKQFKHVFLYFSLSCSHCECVPIIFCSLLLPAVKPPPHLNSKKGNIIIQKILNPRGRKRWCWETMASFQFSASCRAAKCPLCFITDPVGWKGNRNSMGFETCRPCFESRAIHY
jgi:hypothetical protein